MDIPKIINSFYIMHLVFELTSDMKYDNFTKAINKWSRIYNVKITKTNRKTPFATEICYQIHDNVLHVFMNHKYYDGKVISIFSKQVDTLYKNIEEPIKRELFIETNFNIKKELALQLYDRKSRKYEYNIKKIHDFYEPLSITAVINYIKQLENKNIIMLKTIKDKTINADGNNFYYLLIKKNQDFKDAIEKEQKIEPNKLYLYAPFVVANFYTKFHRPSFVEEIKIKVNFFSISTVAHLFNCEFYTLYPQTRSGNYPLYIG